MLFALITLGMNQTIHNRRKNKRIKKRAEVPDIHRSQERPPEKRVRQFFKGTVWQTLGGSQNVSVD
jgi:hypothetical protein